MSMQLLKKHLKEDGKEYYEKVVANHNHIKSLKKKRPSLVSAASVKRNKPSLISAASVKRNKP